MASDYELILNEMFSAASAEQEGWKTGTNLDSASRMPDSLKIARLDGGGLFPKQFQVGNLRLCFDKDGALTCIYIRDKSGQEVRRNVSAPALR